LFEFELTDHSPPVNVKGNLRRKLEFWKRIGTSKFILNVIERRYMPPFLSLPEPAVLRNNRSSLVHAEFVEDGTRELLESGRVVEVYLPPLVVSTIDSIVDSGFVITARKLASFKGQIISTSPVSGNISRIMTRHCVLSTLSVQHWEEKIEFDQYCIEELRFWRTNLNSLKVKDCFLIRKPQSFVYSDASATGCGSVVTLNEDHICHRLWEPSECSKSSTW